MKFRRSELFFSAYFVYLIGLAALRPVAPEIRNLVWTLNPALILWFGLFAWADKSKGFEVLDRVRDWYPIPLILLAYREMGWMALPHQSTAFERYWIVWDRRILNDWGFRAAVECLGPVVPNLLELAYVLVYVVPILMVLAFYVCDARERLDDAYSVLLFGTLTTYALYPFFPSEPPRSVFPGADPPMLTLVRKLNLALVGNYGIHTSVFPSGHSAAAFSAAFAVRRFLPENPWRGRAYLTLAILIGLATIYGRYHYAIDAIAGLAMAGLALGLSHLWRRQPIPRRIRVRVRRSPA